MLNKIKTDLDIQVFDDDTVYYGKSTYLTPRIMGGTVKNKETIFTKFYKLLDNKTVKINIDELPQHFNGLFTIKIRSVANKMYEEKYFTILEVTDILVTDVIDNTLDKDKPLSLKY